MNKPDQTPLHATCPACATQATRESARFCRVCGRKLDSMNEGYIPTDALRASYRAHHQIAPNNKVHTNRPHTFNRHDNQAAHLALAFVAFALVPYLGILFCPGAFIAGCAGIRRAHLAPRRGGRHAATFGIITALIILAAQIFLWWLLYQIGK